MYFAVNKVNKYLNWKPIRQSNILVEKDTHMYSIYGMYVLGSSPSQPGTHATFACHATVSI